MFTADLSDFILFLVTMRSQTMCSSFNNKIAVRPAILNFLLGVFARYPNSPMGERALETVLFTLKAMANGGMHDHVGQVREMGEGDTRPL